MAISKIDTRTQGFTKPPVINTSTFPEDVDLYNDEIPVNASQQNSMADEMNSMADGMNETALDVETNAIIASNGALEAIAIVNSKGAWSGLSGGLSIPASVTHSDSTWVLNTDLVDVTLSEPVAGNTDWTEVSGVTSAELALKADKATTYTKDEVDLKPTGQKNLFLNGRKIIQKRGATGGTKQVSEPVMNVGGSHTISFTGTATVTIYEFPEELADYATTIADIGTKVLATEVSTGTTVTTTAGYYIVAEFSSTDFNDAQLEKGSVATNFEVRHNELELCLRYYEHGGTTPERVWLSGSTTLGLTIGYSVTKRKTPYLVLVGVVYTNASDLAGAAESTSFEISFIGTGDTGGSRVSFLWSVDAEIFNASETYKEDRWFI